MLEYAKLVLSRASKGFALRIDLWYAVIGIIVSGLTGSKEHPLGSLTPFELARYLLVAVVTWWLFRLLLLAPYRIWQEQRGDIARLNLEIERPERIGADELHKLRAHKRLELVAEIGDFQWCCFKGEPVEGDWYNRITRLANTVNLPGVFFRVLGEAHEICLWMKDDPGSELKQKLAGRSVRPLLDYLHGRETEAGLEAIEADLKDLKGGRERWDG